MIKLIFVYITYLIALYVLFSNKVMHLYNGTIGSAICCILIFVILTIMLIIMTLHLTGKKKPVQTGNIENLTPFEAFIQYMKSCNYWLNQASHLGPFQNMCGGIRDTNNGIYDKYNHILRLLKDSFSETDLTYITYIETLNEVLKLAGSNIKGIVRRFEVFDYKGWSKDRCNTLYTQYVDEVQEFEVKNQEINLKLDNLVHELIKLDEISDVSLKELTELIDQTKQYKNV